MGLMARVADKTGGLGSLVSAMGCTSCFPALASLGAAIGLGFLARWEGLFITILIPAFAALALLANALSWLSHRRWSRTALGVIGPLLALSAAVLMRFYGLPSAQLLSIDMPLIVGVSIWDLVSPARLRRDARGCELPPKHS
ncbi:MAG: organomercurial transporter MerC [Burkholderiales bacterium]|nr:organomercurial transporter MerC [Burkholderiales bacterium]MDE2289471.1 organomercurial transporter MerC [Burkholderiales bacterium]MDE2609284.1 organomercurial transporter MerC [Burkholderiales bacterium]